MLVTRANRGQKSRCRCFLLCRYLQYRCRCGVAVRSIRQPDYRCLREEAPVSRLAFPDGKAGWLLTRHQDVRALLADDRFSSDRRRVSSPVRRFPIRPDEPAARAGSLIGMDPPEHTRYRRMLTRYFTVRRMRELAPRIEQVVSEHLDAMERSGPPADLVSAFARPIPSLVICELLGVPYEDKVTFQRCTSTLLRLDADEDAIAAARDELWQYMLDLVAAKRQHPDGALLGSLIQTGAADAALTDERLAGIGQLLLAAGHETTANMLALGTYALLSHPDQLRALREQADLIDAQWRNCCAISPSCSSAPSGSPAKTSTSPAGASGRAKPSSPRLPPPTGTRCSSPNPMSWTSLGPHHSTSPSGTGSTSAWASNSPGWR